jgi:hypothetical protein
VLPIEPSNKSLPYLLANPTLGLDGFCISAHCSIYVGRNRQHLHFVSVAAQAADKKNLVEFRVLPFVSGDQMPS